MGRQGFALTFQGRGVGQPGRPWQPAPGKDFRRSRPANGSGRDGSSVRHLRHRRSLARLSSCPGSRSAGGRAR